VAVETARGLQLQNACSSARLVPNLTRIDRL